MLNHNDMSGKLKFISRMRILAGFLGTVELVAVSWILFFNFLYPNPENSKLSMSWMLLIGMIIPFNWPGAILCGLLSMILQPNAVLILTAAFYIILSLTANRAVWLPSPKSYFYLVRIMRLELVKSFLLMLAGCFIALINTTGQELAAYIAVAVYEAGSAVNILIFYKLLFLMNGMDYREIFQTDGKKPYGQ